MRAALLVVLLILITCRSMAISFEANMDFHASVAGPNVIHPGDKSMVTVLLECEVTGGTIEYLQINENTSEMLPMLTMAKDVRVDPSSSTTVEVKADEILVGDMPCGRPVPVNMLVYVDENARSGDYILNLDIKYNKLSAEIDSGNITLKYNTNLQDSVSVKFRIERKTYDFSVVSVTPNLKAGREGVVEVKIKNSGEEKIYDAVLMINVTPPLRPNPKAMSVYVGDLDRDEERTASFRVFVPEGVFLQSYPAQVVMLFRTSSGMPAKSFKTVGLRVGGTGYFAVEKVDGFVSAAKTIRVEQKMQMPAIPSMMFNQQLQPQQQSMSNVITIPSRGYLTVNITNLGDAVHDAYAILAFDSPLLISTSSPYIGEMQQGESREVTFYITSKAPAGSYLGYVMLKYRDEYGDVVVSPKSYVSVEVSAEPAIKIESVESSNLGVGLVGDVRLRLNSSMSVSSVKLYLVSPDSTVTLVSSSAYIDDVGEIAAFRVSVSDDALPGKHLLYLIEYFDTARARDLVGVAELPVYVYPKLAAFQIVSVKSELYPDSTGEVIIEIKNSGNAEIYNAVVILEVSTPLSIAGAGAMSSFLGQSQPGEYFVGTLKPGDTAVAKFRVTVDKDAGEGSYPASVKVRYQDENGYEHSSNSIVVSLEVKKAQPYVLYAALVLAAIAIVVAGSFVRKKRGGKIRG